MVRILKGCGRILPASDNGIDLPDAVLERLDFVAVGFHPLTGFDERDRSKNTEVLVRVMENPYVDMISHPGNEDEFPVAIDVVIEAAVRNNVIVELNDHSFAPASTRSTSAHREREFAAAALAAGAAIAVGSDAHYATQVGRFDAALAVARELGIGVDRLVNRDARTVLDHLQAKRERPSLDAGGEWTWPPQADAAGEEGDA
jgi:putative hydrolase